MTESIIIALISAGIPTITTAITAILQARSNNKHAAKQSILQMILEDYVADGRKKAPTNYQNILNEYDNYHKNGGNSYVTEKVDDYKRWFIEWQQRDNARKRSPKK